MQRVALVAAAWPQQRALQAAFVAKALARFAPHGMSRTCARSASGEERGRLRLALLID